ncbi:serine protease [Lonsdalea populi]|nr:MULTISPECIES: autotransporter serine protease [Lonsdalea]RAT17424.1 serine protease [Lonsdalea quercina]RAT29105.1 serine protease [Lonsdalea populi]RAT46920.1 serine protease [Lonsdalea populi]RAT51850.1 serine protease [Lonsdalea populi]RAT53322.1 serine protease [Lonsdalea populi]
MKGILNPHHAGGTDQYRRRLTPLACMVITSLLLPAFSAGAESADDFRTREYQNNGLALDAMSAAEAYSLGYSGAGATVGIIDSQSDLSGPEFLGRVADGTQWISTPNQYNRHGYAVAGVVGAAKNNVGIHGLAFNANILSLGVDLSTSSIAYALDIMAQHPEAKIVNNSWGFNIYPDELFSYDADVQSELLDILIPGFSELTTRNAEQGQLLVFSAGNEGHLTPTLLSALPTVLDMTGFENKIANNWLSVMSFDATQPTTSATFIASFSNLAQGAAEYSLLAPGVGIYTTYDQTYYSSLSGTSFSAPYVAAVGALVSEAFPYMSGKQLADVLLSTATPLSGAQLPRAVVLVRNNVDSALNMTGVEIKVYAAAGGITFSDEEMAALVKSLKLDNPFYSMSNGDVEAAILAAAADGSMTLMPQEEYQALFGQGIVNAYKAVQGPGKLDAKRLTDGDLSSDAYGGRYALYSVDTQGSDSTWSNDIIQVRTPHASSALYDLDVGLRKQGDGTLYLTGVDTYRGPTVVEGGRLVVAKSAGGSGSLAGDVWVMSSAVLGGHGKIGGSVTIDSGGTLAPGTSIGTLTVGNVRFTPGSIYEFEIDAQGQSDQLIVEQNASLAGTVRVINLRRGTLGTRYTLLDASGTISGRFDALELSSDGGSSADALFLTDALGYGDHRAWLETVRNSLRFSDVAATANQQAAADALDSLNGGAAYSAIANLRSADVARDAFDNLSGEFYAASRSAMILRSQNVRDALNGAMRSRHDAPLWLTTWSNDGRLSGQQGEATVDHQGYGFLLGSGVQWGESSALGVAVGSEKSRISMNDRASRADITAYHAALYLEGALAGMDWRTGLNYSYLDMSSQRTLHVPGLEGKARASYHAHQAQGFIEGSRHFSITQNLGLEPYANAAYAWLQTPDAREFGSEAALGWNTQNTSSAFSTLGLRGDVHFTAVLPLSLYGDIGYQHRLSERERAARLHFTRGGDDFNVDGVATPKNAVLMHAGLAADLSQHARLSLGYQGMHASKVRDDGVRMQFSVAF